MSAAVLALNPGSSSVKASVRLAADGPPTLRVLIERLGTTDGTITVDDQPAALFAGDLDAAVVAIGAELDRRGTGPAAVAHRVVHGGAKHQQPALIDDALIADLVEAIPFAPLHLPGALESIRLARAQWPDAGHVACFDTAFHRDLPEAARRLPVPPQIAALGVRRYGFHGLSVQSVLLARPDLGDAVIAHLGSGCSVTAVGADGRPRHTTMSMTPTAGMMSATRTGDIDPLIPLYLIENHGYRPDELRRLFDHSSGVAGIADGRRDFRDLLGAADPDAALAVEMFVRSAAMAVASCATTLDSWRSLVFTGGVGEHATLIRKGICDRLRLDKIDVQIVPADEERVMDREARALTASR